MGRDLSAYLRVICVDTTASGEGYTVLSGQRVQACHPGLVRNEGLIQDGYFAPLAEAIALSWKEAIAGLQEQRSAIPDALTLGQVVQFVHKQIVKRAPALFALTMQRQLDSRERLTSLRSMMGGSNDEGLHALFQLQCYQLRQYCAQLLQKAKPNALQASQD